MYRFTLIVLSMSRWVGSAFAAERKPNVIVAFTDDHGYADLSCQGVLDDIRTPNMDAVGRR